MIDRTRLTHNTTVILARIEGDPIPVLDRIPALVTKYNADLDTVEVTFRICDADPSSNDTTERGFDYWPVADIDLV
jgi:hypothetical protein